MTNSNIAEDHKIRIDRKYPSKDDVNILKVSGMSLRHPAFAFECELSNETSEHNYESGLIREFFIWHDNNAVAANFPAINPGDLPPDHFFRSDNHHDKTYLVYCNDPHAKEIISDITAYAELILDDIEQHFTPPKSKRSQATHGKEPQRISRETPKPAKKQTDRDDRER